MKIINTLKKCQVNNASKNNSRKTSNKVVKFNRSTSINTKDKSRSILSKACFLNNKYNPVSLMMRSKCKVISRVTCMIKKSFDDVFLSFFRNPKHFVKLLSALGYHVSPIVSENVKDAAMLVSFERTPLEEYVDFGDTLKCEVKSQKRKFLLSSLAGSNYMKDSYIYKIIKQAI